MRILIFGLPRCGTTSLLNFLIKSLPSEYKWQNEPYHFTTETLDGKDLIVKTVLCNFIALRENETLEENSFKLIEKYDKVIYIRRKNIDNIKKSFTDMIFKRYLKTEREKIKYEDCTIESNDFINEWYDVFDKVTQNKKIYFYEDLYKDSPSDELFNLLSYLNLEFNNIAFLRHIHTSNKEKDENWDIMKLNKTIL